MFVAWLEDRSLAGRADNIGSLRERALGWKSVGGEFAEEEKGVDAGTGS